MPSSTTACPRLILEEERFNRVKKTKKFPKLGLAAGLADLGLAWDDIDVLTTPWDVRLLRKSFASILLRRFPLSLSLAVPSSHASQQNQIVLLNQLSARAMCASSSAT